MPLVEGARCPQHPENGALGACARCGTFTCSLCATTREGGRLWCSACDERAPRPELADRSARFWANVVDTAAIPLPLIATAIIDWGLGRLARLRLPTLGTLIVVAGATASLFVLIHQLRLTRTGESIGKRSRRIRVIGIDGHPVSMFRILVVRNLMPLAVFIVLPFSSVLMVLDALMILRGDRRCLHDLLAGTNVVKLPDE